MTPNKIAIIKDELIDIFGMADYSVTTKRHFVLIDVISMKEILSLEKLCFTQNLYYLIFPLSINTMKISIFPVMEE
jgi:hypothetical protein